VAPTEIVGIPNDDRNLDGFNPEEEPGEPAANVPLMVAANGRAPEPGVRVERATARVAGYALAIAWTLASTGRRAALALRHALALTASRGALARQSASSLIDYGASAIEGIVQAERTRRRARRARRAEESALHHLEAEGSLVAVGLAVVVIGYGILLVMSWRQPATPVFMSAVPAPLAAVVQPTNAGAPTRSVAVARILANRAVDVRPRVRLMNASTLNTIWRRNDTRSLQQAFAGLRRETLAFHRCSVKMTAADRAVAHCDGVAGPVVAGSESVAPRAIWTLDFQRTGGRWAIRRVSSR
jgi:hypothetical protein